MVTKKEKKQNKTSSKEEIKESAKDHWKQNWHTELHNEHWKHYFVSKKVSIFAILLITVGFVALLDSFGIVPGAWSRLWPLFLVIPGVILLLRSLHKQ